MTERINPLDEAVERLKGESDKGETIEHHDLDPLEESNDESPDNREDVQAAKMKLPKRSRMVVLAILIAVTCCGGFWILMINPEEPDAPGFTSKTSTKRISTISTSSTSIESASHADEDLEFMDEFTSAGESETVSKPETENYDSVVNNVVSLDEKTTAAVVGESDTYDDHGVTEQFLLSAKREIDELESTDIQPQTNDPARNANMSSTELSQIREKISLLESSIETLSQAKSNNPIKQENEIESLCLKSVILGICQGCRDWARLSRHGTEILAVDGETIFDRYSVRIFPERVAFRDSSTGKTYDLIESNAIQRC